MTAFSWKFMVPFFFQLWMWSVMCPLCKWGYRFDWTHKNSSQEKKEFVWSIISMTSKLIEPTGWFFDDKWTYSMTRIRIKYSLKRLKLTISTSRAFQNVICYIKIFKSVESSLGSLLILGHYTVLFGNRVKNKLAIHNFFIKNSTICRNDDSISI